MREVSVEISSIRIKEMSSNPDLQAMEAVQALDEVDKTANILSSRLREWYGLHFPELTSMVDDNISLTKLILNFKSRDNFDADLLEQMGYSKAKSKAIDASSKASRGANMRDEDSCEDSSARRGSPASVRAARQARLSRRKDDERGCAKPHGHSWSHDRCSTHREGWRSEKSVDNASQHDPDSGG